LSRRGRHDDALAVHVRSNGSHRAGQPQHVPNANTLVPGQHTPAITGQSTGQGPAVTMFPSLEFYPLGDQVSEWQMMTMMMMMLVMGGDEC
jgi:hypothetical protein